MASIKQSIPEWCFFKDGMDATEVFTRLARTGYAALEMIAPSRWDAAAAAGLPIVTIATEGMQDGMNKVANHARLAASIRGTIATAKARGIPYVIVFSGNRGGMGDGEGIENCVAGFRGLAADAEKAGVTLAFEMLNSFDHVDYMADSSAFGFAVARLVDSRHFRVLYDIYHMHRMGEDVPADLRDNSDLVCHLHVAGSPKRDFPGLRQEIDYAAIVGQVTRDGYTGCWGQEFVPTGADTLAEFEAAAMLFSRYASDHTETAGR
jgi:hydroxypyruvate isomerase